MDQRLRLHYSKFCGLARTPDFRKWLKDTASDLDEYLAQASPIGGCKARAERMVYVYNKLYETGKGSVFESVLKERFPYVIDSDTKPTLKQSIPAKAPPPIAPVQRVDVSKVLDIHGVFKTYKPEILTFPQKRIIVNVDKSQLEAQVNSFTRDKYGVDSIILGDRAYIEYFEPRYKDVAAKIPEEKREIYQYRQKVKNANSISS